MTDPDVAFVRSPVVVAVGDEAFENFALVAEEVQVAVRYVILAPVWHFIAVAIPARGVVFTIADIALIRHTVRLAVFYPAVRNFQEVRDTVGLAVRITFIRNAVAVEVWARAICDITCVRAAVLVAVVACWIIRITVSDIAFIRDLISVAILARWIVRIATSEVTPVGDAVLVTVAAPRAPVTIGNIAFVRAIIE